MARRIGLREHSWWYVIHFLLGQNTDSTQLVYVIVAVSAWYYPNAELIQTNGRFGQGSKTSGAAEAIKHAIVTARGML